MSRRKAEREGRSRRRPGPPGDSRPTEPHHESLGSRLNWLRAGVLGANDGIVSTAGLVVGVAGATASATAVLVAGVAGMFSGALSMALGEYVSVSTQRDTERAALARERRELEEDPGAELEELAGLYRDRGLDADLARRVAEQLTARDALRAHAEVELRLDSDELTDPWQAALASFLSFLVGALVPLLLITLSPADWRVGTTVAAVTAAVALLGAVSARLGGAAPLRAALRCVVGGLLAMAVTFAIGTAVGGAAGA
ncbi:VIT1/CCC1 transporter family protein [Nocardiopsis halophila]|uniref:VIT1/CCC1 transporter family protein n=1 Tax=Nocardiopsis halophila TaxID=141692 RepID=UPI00034C5FE9|nr:VIT family protein [Nocardiopsis halophila]